MTESAEREHVLEIRGLRAAVEGTEILRGVDLTVRSGEVHAVMGPNGSGKSTLAHVVMGRPGYQVLGGSVTMDGADVLAMTPWQRAQAGLFLTLQYPIEVPGVSLQDMLGSAKPGAGDDGRGASNGHAGPDRPGGNGRDIRDLRGSIRAEAERLALDPQLLERAVNVDLSGGERKKNETLQLGVLRPAIAVLDELDSGLDIDALRACARRIEAATEEFNLGVLAITHYSRLLHVLQADRVHVLATGTIVRSGGPELATELNEQGYVGLLGAELVGEEELAHADVGSGQARPEIEDPFGGPGPAAGGDPFADPLAGS